MQHRVCVCMCVFGGGLCQPSIGTITKNQYIATAFSRQQLLLRKPPSSQNNLSASRSCLPRLYSVSKRESLREKEEGGRKKINIYSICSSWSRPICNWKTGRHVTWEHVLEAIHILLSWLTTHLLNYWFVQEYFSRVATIQCTKGQEKFRVFFPPVTFRCLTMHCRNFHSICSISDCVNRAVTCTGSRATLAPFFSSGEIRNLYKDPM